MLKMNLSPVIFDVICYKFVLIQGRVVVVTVSFSDKEVEVKVQGPRPGNIQFLIHEVIEGLVHESFHGVHFDFYVPCRDCIGGVST